MESLPIKRPLFVNHSGLIGEITYVRTANMAGIMYGFKIRSESI